MPMFLVDFDRNAASPGDHTMILVLSLLVLIPFFAYLIMLYVMHGVGLSKLAKRRGIHHPWLAWIPCGQAWLLGCLSDQYQYLANGKTQYFRRWLLGLSIPVCVISTLTYLFFVFAFPFMISSETFLPYIENIGSTAQSAMIWTSLINTLNLASLVLLVFRSLALYQLFSSSYPKYKVPLLLISIFLETSYPILIFAVRDNDSGMPAKRTATPSPTEAHS